MIKEKKRDDRRKGGVHVPLAQHVKHRKSLSRLKQLLLLLQASLSPDECCVRLLRVKRDIREIYFDCASTCVEVFHPLPTLFTS